MNSNCCINVHPLTENPTKAWESLKKTQKCMKIQPPVPKGPVDNNKVRVVCMSDTHSKTSLLKFDIPFGDIFIHAGDFTSCGGLDEVIEFNKWLGTLPHKLKIVIAGNHELSFDSTFTQQSNLNDIPTLGFEQDQIRSAIQHKDIKKYLTNCIYLEDSMIECYGLKIYGSPCYAVIANDMVYVSATYGYNRINRTVPEMFIDEAHQAFQNLSYILEASGASCQSTIKVVIYLTSYKVAKAVNDIYSNYFYAPYCARLQMQVDRLPKNARISVEAIAVVQPVNKIKLEN